MKKKIILLATLASAILLVAGCGKSKEASETTWEPDIKIEETEESKKVVADSSVIGILDSIDSDVQVTLESLNTELQKAYSAVGSTYDSYIKKSDKILEWYELAIDESEKLFVRIRENSIEYFKCVAKTVDTTDYDAVDDALDEYYDRVYEDAMDDYYEAMYEDVMDEIYDTYYDGVIDEAPEGVEYGDWYDVRSDFYDNWYDSRSDIYDNWYDYRSDLYDDWYDINSEFLYDDNFDVNDILGLESESKTSQEASSTESEKTTTVDKTKESTEVLDNIDWRQFLTDYEVWVDDYIALINKYKENPTDVSLLSDYTEMLGEMAEWAEDAENMELSITDTAEAAEYSQEVLRIAGKLAEVAQK